MPKYTLTRQKFLSEPEYEQFVRTCIVRMDDPRYLFLLLLGLTGARVSEGLAWTPSHFDPEEKFVVITGNKGSNDRELPILPDFDFIWPRLTALFPKDPHERIWKDTRNAVSVFWKYHFGGTMGKKLHSLRHTFGQRLMARGRDIREVKWALGHVGINNTLIYLDYAMDRERIRKALSDAS